MIRALVCFFSLAGTFVFAQKKGEIAITGTVYINLSVSLGILNGGSISEPQRVFKYQTIYFKNDSTTASSKTDSAGVFSVALKPGIYTVYQEAGLNGPSKGLDHYGQGVIEVKKEIEKYEVFFKNSSNRRSTMMNKGIPGKESSGTKSIKKSN